MAPSIDMDIKPICTPQKRDTAGQNPPEVTQQSMVPIDLTQDEDEDSATMQTDHMHPVADLLRSQARKRASSATTTTAPPPPPKLLKKRPSAPSPSSHLKSRHGFKIPAAFALPSPSPRKPFRFLDLPPELRNTIYTHLLTHPLPLELTSSPRTAAARSAQWAQAQTTRRRRAGFKHLFLEILQTNSRVHAEATSILYGGNVFKFRSEGVKKSLPLPQKYMGLLQHVKVCVISDDGKEWVRQGKEGWVAELVGWFAGARLKTFEMAWYGWGRYVLRREGGVCAALGRLRVEGRFMVRVGNMARMERGMVEELEKVVGAEKMEIQRPVVRVWRGGREVEVSDEEE